jgi:glycosyltransferase involved in cell wall biosynthesis
VRDRGGDLVIVIPLWRRTANIDRVWESARAATPDARILFVVSAGDSAVLAAITEAQGRYDALILDGKGGERGDYAQKINAGYRATDRPFIFTGADDLLFHPGWYDAARALMTDEVGVVGTVDRCNGRTTEGSHSTHSLVARWYADQGACIDEDHVIYKELYWHEFCDDEMCRTAMSRGAYAHAYDAIVEHRHMLIDSSLDDPTYRHGRSNTARSRNLFRRRRLMWGDGRRSSTQIRSYPRRVVR